ncbi:hypothetical protein ACLOJK_002768 [Asimina triloba]
MALMAEAISRRGYVRKIPMAGRACEFKILCALTPHDRTGERRTDRIQRLSIADVESIISGRADRIATLHVFEQEQLNQVAPLENLRHVKRVQKVVAEELKIVDFVEAQDLHFDLFAVEFHWIGPRLQSMQLYRKRNGKNSASFGQRHITLQLKRMSISIVLYDNLHGNIDGITGFSEEDSQSIFDFMKVAIKLCKSGHRSDQVVNAAVIVDPSIRQVITSAYDQTCLWPPFTSQRSVESSECRGSADFMSIQPDANSLTSNGPFDSDYRSIGDIGAYAGVSCLHPWRWAEQLPSAQPQPTPVKCGSSFLWHPLHHAAIVAIEQAAARDMKLFPSSEPSKCQASQNDDHLQLSSTNLPAKRQKTQVSVVICLSMLQVPAVIHPYPSGSGLFLEDDERCDISMNGSTSVLMRPYLCTGLDIYLVWEPCTMCAMALVHQRIRRIFFAFPNPHSGALGSVHRLQGERSLNHHYAVFRVMLPVEVLEEMTSNDANP